MNAVIKINKEQVLLEGIERFELDFLEVRLHLCNVDLLARNLEIL